MSFVVGFPLSSPLLYFCHNLQRVIYSWSIKWKKKKLYFPVLWKITLRLVHDRQSTINGKNRKKKSKGSGGGWRFFSPRIKSHERNGEQWSGVCKSDNEKKIHRIMCTLIYVIFHSFRNTRQDMIETKRPRPPRVQLTRAV